MEDKVGTKRQEPHLSTKRAVQQRTSDNGSALTKCVGATAVFPAAAKSERLGTPSAGSGPSRVTHPCAHPACATGQPHDAGHSSGYFINMGERAVPVSVYRSCSGALAVCLIGTAATFGAQTVNSIITSIQASGKFGDPWVAKVWSAYHNIGRGGSNPLLMFARVNHASQIIRRYWLDDVGNSIKGLPGVVMVLEELDALVAVVSRLVQYAAFICRISSVL